MTAIEAIELAINEHIAAAADADQIRKEGFTSNFTEKAAMLARASALYHKAAALADGRTIILTLNAKLNK